MRTPVARSRASLLYSPSQAAALGSRPYRSPIRPKRLPRRSLSEALQRTASDSNIHVLAPIPATATIPSSPPPATPASTPVVRARRRMKKRDIMRRRRANENQMEEPAPAQEVTAQAGAIRITVLHDMFCPLCSVIFDSKEKMQKHCRRTHGDCNFLFTCPKCGKGNKKIHPFACHIGKCKASQLTPLRGPGLDCKHCDQRFRTTGALTNHLRLWHVPFYMEQMREKRKAKVLEIQTRLLWKPEEVKILKEQVQQKKSLITIWTALGKSKTLDQIKGKIKRMKAQSKAHPSPSQAIARLIHELECPAATATTIKRLRRILRALVQTAGPNGWRADSETTGIFWRTVPKKGLRDPIKE